MSYDDYAQKCGGRSHADNIHSHSVPAASLMTECANRFWPRLMLNSVRRRRSPSMPMSDWDRLEADSRFTGVMRSGGAEVRILSPLAILSRIMSLITIREMGGAIHFFRYKRYV
jgi:hypothetical protein